MNTKTEKPKSFDTKTEKPIQKIAETAKPKIPMSPSLRGWKRGQDMYISCDTAKLFKTVILPKRVSLLADQLPKIFFSFSTSFLRDIS